MYRLTKQSNGVLLLSLRRPVMLYVAILIGDLAVMTYSVALGLLYGAFWSTIALYLILNLWWHIPSSLELDVEQGKIRWNRMCGITHHVLFSDLTLVGLRRSLWMRPTEAVSLVMSTAQLWLPWTGASSAVGEFVRAVAVAAPGVVVGVDVGDD